MDKTLRLIRAREALAQAEKNVGLEKERGVGAVLDLPTSGGPLLRATRDLLPPHGCCAFLHVPNIGWQAAHRLGLDFDRLLIVPRAPGREARTASALIDHVDVLCIGDIPLSFDEQRRLAAQARASGHVILTLTPWQGISRPWAPRRRLEAVV